VCARAHGGVRETAARAHWMRSSTLRLMSRCSLRPKSLNMVEPPDSTTDR
jgi:hypothetical protein